MSNVKRMDIWTAVRTVLEKNPAIKSGQLWRKVQKKTGLGRSTIYENLCSFELRGKIHREKGMCYLPSQLPLKSFTPEDKRVQQSIKSGFGLFDWWERRAERRDHEARRIDAEGEIINEIAMFWCKHGRAPTSEEKWKIQEKWGKRYKVEPGDLHPIGV